MPPDDEEWEPWDPYDVLAQDGDALGYDEPADYGLRRVRDLRTAPGLLDYPREDEWPRNAETCDHGSLYAAPCGECPDGVAGRFCEPCAMGYSCARHNPRPTAFDEQRPADFDDEEARP